MAIKMNATTHQTNKDFRHNIDIRERIPSGKKGRTINLPPDDFAYGVPNRTPTPIKEVINNEYGNKAEQKQLRKYSNIIREKEATYTLVPKTTKHWNRLMSAKIQSRTPFEEKPLYKMKMFQGTKSKVAEGVNTFKKFKGENSKFNYNPKRNDIAPKTTMNVKRNIKYNEYGNDGVDEMINKVQNEIQEGEYQQNLQYKGDLLGGHVIGITGPTFETLYEIRNNICFSVRNNVIYVIKVL